MELGISFRMTSLLTADRISSTDSSPLYGAENCLESTEIYLEVRWKGPLCVYQYKEKNGAAGVAESVDFLGQCLLEL